MYLASITDMRVANMAATEVHPLRDDDVKGKTFLQVFKEQFDLEKQKNQVRIYYAWALLRGLRER